MKFQVRRGVFETNSSSTHSLQITRGGVTEAKSDIIKNMFSTEIQKYNSTIDGNKITITGLDCETGGDSEDIYTIITSWESKLQYLASQLFGIYEDEEDDVIEEFKELFKKCVINITAKYGITINEVVYDVKYTNWPEEIYSPEDFQDHIRYDPHNMEDIEKYVEIVMDDSFVLTFGSEAYSSYEGRKIIIVQ